MQFYYDLFASDSPMFPMDLEGLINASISDECNVMLTTILTSEEI